MNVIPCFQTRKGRLTEQLTKVTFARVSFRLDRSAGGRTLGEDQGHERVKWRMTSAERFGAQSDKCKVLNNGAIVYCSLHKASCTCTLAGPQSVVLPLGFPLWEAF